MNTIKLKDSELYDLLLEVCEELGYTELMPSPCSLFTHKKTDAQRAAVAASSGSVKPFKEGDDIKEYITELVETSVKRYGNGGILYPFKIQKGFQNEKLILRGAFQPEGYKTNFKSLTDKDKIKAELDAAESKS